MTVTIALKEALNDAISSGKFIDTKIVLFSRRDGSGRVCKPKALYANSHVLKSVPYFDALLSGPFSESEIKDFTETVDNGEFAEDYGYSSDSDLEEDWDFESPAPPQKDGTQPSQEALYGQYKEHVQMGKVIRIKDVAFITFQAFLLYLYADSITFAPFGFEENRKSRSPEIAWTPEGKTPKPSPKSIYRLADKYDVPALKTIALENIKRNLQKCDIVQEAFSVFTSRYSEIRAMQVNCLLSVWLLGSEGESTAVRDKLDEKIDSYAAGKLDHAVDIISSIWEVSSGEGPVTPGPTLRESIPAWPDFFPFFGEVPFTGYDMQPALVRSIKEGSLLDRKYWARRSRGVIEPIYFPSIVAQAELSRLETSVWLHLVRLGGHLVNRDDHDEYAEDSDYESEPNHSASQSTKADSERKQELRVLPVLRAGSRVAWTSLFFYLVTGEIRFAPLKSQGLEGRSQSIRENATPGSPVPCSPKTIYLLAKKLLGGNRPGPALCHIAFKDIEAKLKEENIVSETFSGFAAEHPEIMEMGWKHLGAELKTDSTKTSVLEFIKGMEGGDAAHRADALKFGLYNALRQKSPAQSTLAMLRCTGRKCPANESPVSYLTLGGKISCPRHYKSDEQTMKCSECGHERVDHYVLCKGCRRLFE